MQNNVFVRIRHTAGLTQKQFAKAIGVATVECWEQGKHFPNYASMRKLMEFCSRAKIDSSEIVAAWSRWKESVEPGMKDLEVAGEDSGTDGEKHAQENPFIRIRKTSGMSQKDFARRIGVKSVVNWERGRCFPNYASMKKIARYCEENQIDYSDAQEAWKQKNRMTSENKCTAQQQRWKRIRDAKCPRKDKITLIREFLSQCNGNSEFEVGVRYAAAQMLEILEQKRDTN